MYTNTAALFPCIYNCMSVCLYGNQVEVDIGGGVG